MDTCVLSDGTTLKVGDWIISKIDGSSAYYSQTLRREIQPGDLGKVLEIDTILSGSIFIKASFPVRELVIFYFTPSEVEKISGPILTPLPTCSVCGKTLSFDGDNVVADGKCYCTTCYRSLYTTCAVCGASHLKTDCVEYKGSYFCKTCADRYLTKCKICGNLHSKNDCYRIHPPRYRFNSNYDFDYVCDACRISHNLRHCYSCGYVILSSADEIRFNNHIYCRWCDVPYISCYSYKPKPIFKTVDKDLNDNKSLYMGFELEVDEGGTSNSLAKEVIKKLPFVYCKTDGSLKEGFEIVSHPGTMRFHAEQKAAYSDVCTYLQDKGYTSDNNTCGLHVHINKSFFGDLDQDVDLGAAKMLYLFEKYWSKLFIFSRRSSHEVAQWCKKMDDYDFNDTLLKNLDKAKGRGRYYALNLENRNTMEYRLFKGTLNVDTFMAALQLVNVFTRFADSHTPEELQQSNWRDIFNTQNYAELTNYLESKSILQ